MGRSALGETVMKPQSVLNFVIFVCLLAVGYSVSSRFYRADTTRLSDQTGMLLPVGSKGNLSLNNGQRSILIIGVNSLDTSAPLLTSVWLISSLPVEKTLIILPIFPSGKGSVSELEASLQHSFSLARKNGNQALSQDFTNVLVDHNYWWSGYVIFDQVALTSVIDLLGGVDINGELISGDQKVAELPDVMESPQDAFQNQVAIAQAVCHNLTSVASDPGWPRLVSLVPTHILTDLDVPHSLTKLATSLSGQQASNCRFPTLQITMNEN